ncbi:ABC transporter ATP-binding protein [Shimazuella alba]|uniref:ABC transporter ATP-binding protein n=1 Tax=Shimazuella alba TaxID=2690964 RepID=UPI001F453064|nr:ABC transporter ATP-binding protein [Shimazuella alba]
MTTILNADRFLLELHIGRADIIPFYTENISIQYQNHLVVDQLNLQIPIEKVTAIIGANGCGKSTILKTLARILEPSSGSVYLDGKQIHKESTKQIAKQLAILPQLPEAPEGTTVKELVSFGRFPHRKGFGYLSKHDQHVIEETLVKTGLLEFKDKPVHQLSGGQRQRAWIAMAITQETPYLLLDEPTTYLDIAHQLDVLSLIKQLNEEENRTIIMVVHDLNHAARYADHIVAVKQGKIYTEGAPSDVLTHKMLKDVFQVKANIIVEPHTGLPTCIPYEKI